MLPLFMPKGQNRTERWTLFERRGFSGIPVGESQCKILIFRSLNFHITFFYKVKRHLAKNQEKDDLPAKNFLLMGICTGVEVVFRAYTILQNGGNMQYWSDFHDIQFFINALYWHRITWYNGANSPFGLWHYKTGFVIIAIVVWHIIKRLPALLKSLKNMRDWTVTYRKPYSPKPIN